MVNVKTEYPPDCISGMDLRRLEELARRLGEPAYRARQLRGGVFRGLAFSFEEMTDLPAAFRRRLEAEARLHSLAPAHLAGLVGFQPHVQRQLAGRAY